MFPNNSIQYLIILSTKSPTVGACQNCGVNRSRTAPTARALKCDYCGENAVMGSRVINQILGHRG